MVTQNIKDGILTVAKQTSDLKVDLRNLRRIQQLNNESMTDSIQETIKKITVSQYFIYFTVLETSAPWEIFTPRSKICKSNKTIWIFNKKFAKKGHNPVHNLSIYNVEGNIRLSPCQQTLTTGSVVILFFFSPIS